MKAQGISLGEKEYLNPGEAIRYWNLSARKFYKFLDKGPHSFVVLYGTRRLILRLAFDEFLNDNPQTKEALANGTRADKKRLQA